MNASGQSLPAWIQWRLRGFMYDSGFIHRVSIRNS